MNTHVRKLRYLLPAVALLFAQAQLPSQAAIVSTEQAASAEKIQADREKVRDFMNRADVEKQMKALGVSAALVKPRVDALSDQEVAAIAGKIDSLPAGGNLTTLDIVIILLVVILVAVLI